jgi:hypothetical protein
VASKNHIMVATKHTTPPRCVGCRTGRVLYGDRCGDCQRKLRQRQRRRLKR